MRRARFFPLALALFAGLAISVAPAAASIVEFHSLPGNNTSFGSGAGYLANWNALKLAFPGANPGYGDAPVPLWDFPGANVDNHDMIPGGSLTSIAFHFKVTFSIDAMNAGVYDFRIAPDFGFGGAVFLDGVEVGYNPNDMWWNLDWNNTSQLFTFSANLAPGTYVLDMYGQEGCCDGPTAGQFRTEGGDWISFGDNDGLSPVPAPASVLAMAMSLAAAAGLSLRKRGK